MSGPIGRVDGALGHLLERLTVSHHRRRLRRVGWEASMDAALAARAEQRETGLEPATTYLEGRRSTS